MCRGPTVCYVRPCGHIATYVIQAPCTCQEFGPSDAESLASLDFEDRATERLQTDLLGYLTHDSFVLHLRRSRRELPQDTETFGSNDCMTNAMLESLAARGLLVRHLTPQERRQYCAQVRIQLNALADPDARPVCRDESGVAILDGPTPYPPLEHGP